MVILANLLMVAVALILIGAAFFSKNNVTKDTLEEKENKTGRKELLFSALGEIEFDYRMNKLDADDYEQLKSGYQQEAILVLDREDKEIEMELEKELTKQRKAKK